MSGTFLEASSKIVRGPKPQKLPCTTLLSFRPPSHVKHWWDSSKWQQRMTSNCLPEQSMLYNTYSTVKQKWKNSEKMILVIWVQVQNYNLFLYAGNYWMEKKCIFKQFKNNLFYISLFFSDFSPSLWSWVKTRKMYYIRWKTRSMTLG